MSTAGDTRPLIAFAHSGANWITGAEQCLLDLLSGLSPTASGRW